MSPVGPGQDSSGGDSQPALINIGGAGHRVSGTLVVGDVNPTAQKYKFIIELVVLGFLGLITIGCLMYAFMGTDDKSRDIALNVVVGTISALVGYVAGKNAG